LAQETISIRTTDGACQAHVLTPDSGTPGPAVVFFMDGFGIRPTLIDMAKRISARGFIVLVPDMYYRFGPYSALVPIQVLKQDFRAITGPMMATTGFNQAVADSRFFIDYLVERGDVSSPKIGTIGFCLGGGMSLAAAGAYPYQVAAAASFHGGNLASDSPDSPHLLAKRSLGEIYVAGADGDSSYPPEMADRLERTLTEAGVKHRCEIYNHCSHGWMVPDLPIFDSSAAERGWGEALALFERNLQNSR
jgi:carboxymethylenebutenolidase